MAAEQTDMNKPQEQNTNVPKFIQLILSGEINKAKDHFQNKIEDVEKAAEQFNIRKHKVMERANKVLDDGSIIDQWTLPVPFQKKIVESAVTFLFGKPVKLIQESEGTDDAFQIFKDIWQDMRMDARNKELARRLFSETQVARLYFAYRDEDADKTDLSQTNKLKCVLLGHKNGDKIHVKFDEYGKLIAIGREYLVRDPDTKKDIENFDVYTAKQIYFSVKEESTWVTQTKTNLLGKIAIGYYEQEQSEWDDASFLIDRFETLISRRADVNDYSADPILVLEGDIESLPEKSDVGKVVNLSKGGKASYLTPEMGVEMVKDERESLKELINYFTDTPDLSLEKMSKLGQTSGKAMELMFFAAILKALSKQELFSEMLDREINIIRAFIERITHQRDSKIVAQIKKLKIRIEFGNPLPDNLKDLVDMLATATAGKQFLSTETAAAQLPFVKDVAEEQKKIDKDRENDELAFGGDPMNQVKGNNIDNEED